MKIPSFFSFSFYKDLNADVLKDTYVSYMMETAVEFFNHSKMY